MKRFFCVLFACMLVLGIAFIAFGYQNGASTALYWSDGKIYTEAEFDALADTIEVTEFPDGISALALNLSSAEVTIRQGDEFYALVDYKKGNAPKVCVEDGVMRFEEEQSGFVGFNFSPWASLEKNTVSIALPESVVCILDIRLHAGSLSIEDVAADAVTIAMSMGDAELTEMSVQRLSVSCDMGDMTVLDGAFGTAELDANMGNISFSGSVRESMRAQSDMGDISLSGAFAGDTFVKANLGNVSICSQLPQSAYALDFSTKLGDMSIDGEDVGVDAVGASFKREGGENSFAIHAEMGDILVQFAAEE